MHLHPRPPQATLIISLLDLGLKIWSKSPDVLFDQIYVVSKIFRIIQFRSEKKIRFNNPKSFIFFIIQTREESLNKSLHGTFYPSVP